MEYMWMPLKRYADFSGRSRRQEYWLFFLGIMIAFIALTIITGMTVGFEGADGDLPSLTLMVIGVMAMAIFIPSLAVQVRRFHDQNRSGWFVLLGFIPYIGSLIVLVFMLLPGTPGDNRFGPDPRDENLDEVFA